MQIEYININQIRPYENNPRNNDGAVSAVMESIKEFGFKVPLVIDKNNIIVCGHTRYKASKELGITSIPCIKADDLTDEQIRAFRIADNKVAELAEWDTDKLDLELGEIENIEMCKFGFDDISLDTSNEESSINSELEDDENLEDIEKLEKHYGIPYQGNKSRIADLIINILPPGKRFVDLFGGGGAMTHCAMLSNKWDSYLYNDINPLPIKLFIDAANGKYRDEKRVISREEFNSEKEKDAYVKYIWSFGNNGKNYLWGEDIEEYKLQACKAVLSDSMNERRLNLSGFLNRIIKNNDYKKLIKLNRLESLQRLVMLQELESISSLEAFQKLETSSINYTDYSYKDGDVVYCDIPYEENLKGVSNCYGVNFDNKAFYEWAKKQDFQVFFSSYEISNDDFFKKKIKSINNLMSTANQQVVNEYIYSNKEF